MAFLVEAKGERPNVNIVILNGFMLVLNKSIACECANHDEDGHHIGDRGGSGPRGPSPARWWRKQDICECICCYYCM